MRLFILVPLLLLLSNCSTTPDSTGPHTDVGVWEGKVLMTNLKTKHKKWANLTWVSDSSNDRMRVNVSAVMNLPVATFLKSDGENQLWLFTENRHFTSGSGEKLFKYLTKLSLDPIIFYSMLGRPRSPGEEWKCEESDGQFKCNSVSLKTRFSVAHDTRDERKILFSIQSPSTYRFMHESR